MLFPLFLFIADTVPYCKCGELTMVAIVITGRGGAGKTTLTANLSTYFASQGYKVLAIDGDLYLPKLAFHFGIDNPKINLHTLLKDPKIKINDAVYQDMKTGVYILPGSSNLYEMLDVSSKRLREIVNEIKTRFNITIIDSPVGIPFDTIPTFKLANYQIIVIELERSPIYSVRKMIENEVIKLKQLGEAYELKVGVIINKIRESSRNIEPIINFLENEVEVPVIGVVPFDLRVPEATNLGMPVLIYKPRTKASRGINRCGKSMEKWIFGVRKKESYWDQLYRSVIRILNIRRF